MNELKATINFTKQTFVINGVDLISGDYNSTKIIFNFEDFKDGTKILEIRPKDSQDKNPTFMSEIKNNEVILVSKDSEGHSISPFTNGGVYLLEVSVYGDNSKLSTITKSINVLSEQIILSDDIVTPYLPIFDELIQEINTGITETNNLNITISKDNGITTITLTKKDGTTSIVTIKDGINGTDGRGIVSITKTSTSGLVDTYTITYTDGTTSTFEVTNGEDGEVTQEELDETNRAIDYYKLTLNALPKVEGQGTSLTLDDTAEAPMKMILGANMEQETTTGKNIIRLRDGIYTHKGIKAEVSNNIVKLSGTANDSSTASVIDIKLENIISSSLGTLTKSLNPSGSFSNVQTSLRDSTGNSPVGLWSNNAAKATGTLSEDAYYFRIQVNYNITVDATLKCQIELGDEETDYEPYTGGIASPNPSYPQDIHVVTGDNTITVSNSDNTQSQTLSLTLGDLEYCKIGDYEDEFVYNTTDTSLELNKWYLKKNIGKVVLDGSEDWADWAITSEHPEYLTGYLLDNYVDYDNSRGADIRAICNYFKVYSNAWVYAQSFGLRQVGDTLRRFYVAIDKNITPTLEDYKTWLGTHNTILYYVLATPEYIPLNDTLQSQLTEIYNWVKAYQDQTNISQVNNDLPFVIKASALKDISNL